MRLNAKLNTCLLACVLATSALCADAASGDTKTSIEMKIEKLERQKRGLEERAKQAERDSSRLMFGDHTAARSRELDAKHCKKKIKEIDEEIKALKKSK